MTVSRETLFDAIEPGISLAREILRAQAPNPLAGAAPTLRAMHGVLDACAAFLQLHREPVHRVYVPARALKPLLDAASERVVVRAEATSDCTGDAEQILVAARLIVDNAILESDAILLLDLFEEEEVPQLSVRIDGPGRFREPLLLADFLDLPFDGLALRWTAATRGGRLDTSAQRLTLRLRGVRVIPESAAGVQELLEPLVEAQTRLAQVGKLATAQAGGEVPQNDAGQAELSAIVTQLEAILNLIESGGRGPEPASLGAILEDAAATAAPKLKANVVAADTLCDRCVPPVVMKRDRMRQCLARAFDYAARALAAGGAMSVLVDYDASNRNANVMLSYDGARRPDVGAAYLASMRRAVAESHAGTYTCDISPTNVTVAFGLPDAVGRELDAWIPAWGAFSERSQQILRLLKSGGPTPPADFLLEGVLEEELERWLLPLLESPLIANLAHELPANGAAAPGGSPERRDKVLGQIRRRKPRKEIAQPPYAAEIIWAFHGETRGREALRLAALNTDQTKSLCTALIQKPSAYVDALRLIARVVAPNMPQIP